MPITYFDTFLAAIQECSDRRGVLGDDELVYPPSEHWADYWCEPRNALTFGQMGVDGVHYAIVKVHGEIRDDSPVIHVSPMDFSSPYCVLGATFLEYLAVACMVSNQTMAGVFDQQRAGQPALVSFLKQEFDSSRLYRDERLNSLASYLSLVEAPDE